MKLYSSIGALMVLGHASARTIMLGDSMFAGGSSVKTHLEKFSGVPIENHSVVGASLHSGWVTSVPEQYDRLNKDPMPTTIVMDGGGNDVLSHAWQCRRFTEDCRRAIDEASGIAGSLMERMAKDGVQHVLYMGPYYVAGMDSAVDYGADRLRAMCAAAPLDCQFVDMRGVAMPLSGDRIHPTQDGYYMLAQHIWDLKLAANVPVF